MCHNLHELHSAFDRLKGIRILADLLPLRIARQSHSRLLREHFGSTAAKQGDHNGALKIFNLGHTAGYSPPRIIMSNATSLIRGKL